MVEHIGQECIGSRWVVTRKEAHDGQKMQIKARFVAGGFQEVEKPKLDSPTVAKECLKVLATLASNKDFELVLIDTGGEILVNIGSRTND